MLMGEWGEKMLTLGNFLWPLILVGLGLYLIIKRTRSV